MFIRSLTPSKLLQVKASALPAISYADFLDALQKIRPSVSNLEPYETFAKSQGIAITK